MVTNKSKRLEQLEFDQAQARAERERKQAERENAAPYCFFAVVVDTDNNSEPFLCLDADGGTPGRLYGDGMLVTLTRRGTFPFLLFDVDAPVTLAQFYARQAELIRASEYKNYNPHPNDFGIFPDVRPGTVYARYNNPFGAFVRAAKGECGAVVPIQFDKKG